MRTPSFALLGLLLAVVALQQPAIAAGPALVTTSGGIAVTGEDVAVDVAQRMAPETRAQTLAQPGDVAQLAIAIAARRMLAAEAEAAQLDKDPVVATQLRLARERVLADARMAQIDGKEPDSATLEKAALTEYRAQPEKYRTPEEIRVRHILIDARSCEAEKRITELLQRARAPGADFAALASEYSQDPGTAKRGGDLGFFSAGRMPADFEKAAFALENPGDLSGVVQTKSGWHIIRLEERRPAAQQPFDKVRESIVRDLTARDVRSRRAQVTEALMKDIRVDKDAVEGFARQTR